jgi:hypothetical protein
MKKGFTIIYAYSYPGYIELAGFKGEMVVKIGQTKYENADICDYVAIKETAYNRITSQIITNRTAVPEGFSVIGYWLIEKAQEFHSDVCLHLYLETKGVKRKIGGGIEWFSIEGNTTDEVYSLIQGNIILAGGKIIADSNKCDIAEGSAKPKIDDVIERYNKINKSINRKINEAAIGSDYDSDSDERYNKINKSINRKINEAVRCSTLKLVVSDTTPTKSNDNDVREINRKARSESAKVIRANNTKKPVVIPSFDPKLYKTLRGDDYYPKY